MSDDIVARLRFNAMHFGKMCRPGARTTIDPEFILNLCEDWRIAADEIERLRNELGQVSDADSWVSEADAAHLDSLLNWCEFHDMNSHRALQRLVADRASLRAEVNRLRAGGCARDQTTTQFCAEAERLRTELAARCGGGGAGAHTAGPTEHFIPEAL